MNKERVLLHFFLSVMCVGCTLMVILHLIAGIDDITPIAIGLLIAMWYMMITYNPVWADIWKTIKGAFKK